MENQNQSLQLANIQTGFVELSKSYLSSRGVNNQEFQTEFYKTGTDLLFSQPDEILEKLEKTKPQSLMNAIFMATELSASFAKKEIYFIPYEIIKTETVKGVTTKTKTGEYTALIIPDANFQKQLILKLENCKRFFTAEVYDGVQPVKNLCTGNWEFEGKNDSTKNTIGYYARFEATDGQIYDLFMSNTEIVGRAEFSPQFKADKYKNTKNNIHYEKIVIRNILKEIPKISTALKSTISMEFSDYVEIEETKPNALEEAKKELSEMAKTEAAPVSFEQMENDFLEKEKIEDLF